jgi:outer membrane protein assembly factor BamB
MKDKESKVPWDEEVEITDLESPDQTSNSLVSQTVVRFVLRAHSSSKKPIIFAFLISILVLLPAIQSGSSPIFRQISDNSDLAKPSSEPPLVNVSAANGTAYILASDGTLEAHRAVDGMPLWQHKLAFPPSTFLWASNNVLYIAWLTDWGGNVAELRGSDGSFLWEQQMGPPGPEPLMVKDGVVYVNTRGGTVEALSSSDGSALWYYSSGMNMPLDGFLSVTNGTASIRTKDSMVYVLRVSDGSQILHYHFEEGNSSWTPYVDDGIMYITNGIDSVRALRVNDGKLLWQYSSRSNTLWSLTVANGIVYLSIGDGTIKALRGKDGVLLWQHQTDVGISPATLVQDKVIYITTHDGTIAALRTSDGSLLWQRRVNSHELSYKPVIADGVLYFGLNDSFIEACRGSDGSFLWRYTSTSPIFWYPNVVDGLMFIKHMNGTMDVLQMSTGAILWHYPENK